MKGPPPLRVELARSRLGAAFVAVAWVASALLLVFVPGPMIPRLFAVVAIGAYALWTLRHWALRAMPSSIVAFELAADGAVVLFEQGGARRRGRVQPSSYVGTWLVTLVVRLDGSRWSRSIALLPDMISAEEMRRLRVMLRIAGAPRRSDVPRSSDP
jgi:hypothetical protein